MTFAERFPATQHADFRRLWAGATMSSIGLWTLFVANNWVVFNISGSSAKVGLTTFAFMFGFLLAPIGGTIADHVERRKLAIVLRFAALALALGLFALALANALDVWVIVVFSFALGTVSAVRDPSDQALLGNVVPHEHIASAVTLHSMSRHGSRAIGPLLGAPLLAAVGPEGVYALGAVLSVGAVISLSRVETVSRGGAAAASAIFSNLREGISYIRRTKPVLALFVIVTAHCALTMSYDAMLPGFARDELGGGSGYYTVLTVGMGTGALLGTAILSATTNSPRGRLLLGATAVSGAAPVAFAFTSALGFAIPAALLVGGSQAMFMAMSGVLLQETVPDALRGRVMSLYAMSAGGIMAFSNLGYGRAADAWSAPPMFAIPGVTFLVVAVILGLVVNHLRTTFKTGRLPSPDTAVGEAAGG